jgi:hypothetical protein
MVTTFMTFVAPTRVAHITHGQTIVAYCSEAKITIKRDNHSSRFLALVAKTSFTYFANEKWLLVWLVADGATKTVPQLFWSVEDHTQ